MKSKLRRFVILGLGFFLAVSAPAQIPTGGQAGMNAALLKLFGEFPAFTSRAEVRLQDKPGRATTTLAMDFAMLDGKVRMDLDMDSVKSSQVAPEMLASLKAAGLSKLVTVMRPDRTNVLLIYPNAKSFAEIPMAKEEAADAAKRFRIEKTKVGKETIDGHACEKTKVILRSDAGDKQEALVWYATDLRNFPLRVELDQPEATVQMNYRDVKLAQVDGRQFEAPSGFARYANVETLMQSVMIKSLGGGKK